MARRPADAPEPTSPSDDGDPDAVRLIAFYLPQYHRISENDEWWGEGFTDWNNVRRAQPVFPGHQQPRVPGELGYYDLDDPVVRAAQAELARTHGIHGFCWYHYWFSGKRLLERPFAEVLASGQPDFPFALCWANESWTRRWDGLERDVLQEQSYSPKDDRNHIRALMPALADPRAIRVDGKSLLIVYQGWALPEPQRLTDTWREQVTKAGLPGLHLLTVETGLDAGWDATTAGFDGKVRFQPQFTLMDTVPRVPMPDRPKLRVHLYPEEAPLMGRQPRPPYRSYETVFPGWDNTPRRGEEGVVVHGTTPERYGEWLRREIVRARANPPGDRLVFINAWNEWAEGAFLEPDAANGRRYLEATRSALRSSIAGDGQNGHRTSVVAQPRRAASPTPEWPLGASTLDPRDGDPTLPRVIAFYLPQFHPIPENDRAWGMGYTEWTGVSSAKPQYQGHRQPRVPADLGYYDLREPEVMDRQAELAARFGISAFCYYYYWFDGRKLLDMPLERMLETGRPDFPFCMCWANENWTRRWDGGSSEIIVAQRYGEDTSRGVIQDLARYFRSDNYVRVGGRPLVLVYNVADDPSFARTARIWREHCRSEGLGEIAIGMCATFELSQRPQDPAEFGCDYVVEFPTHQIGLLPRMTTPGRDDGFAGTVHDYRALVERCLRMVASDQPTMRSVLVGWDNTPRRQNQGTVLERSSPLVFQAWLESTLKRTITREAADDRVTFLIAWNEWGEGSYLEPDTDRGLKYLEAVSAALESVRSQLAIASVARRPGP
jgi:lipopolysaccharide biosynthesis protein